MGSHYHAEDFNRINEIVKRNSVQYSIYFHAHLADEPLFRGVPFFYLVNPDGKVVHQANGYSQANMEGLEKAISDALANMPPADSLCGDVTAVHFKEEVAELLSGLDGLDGELAFRKGCPNVPEDANNYRAPITIIGDDDFIERTKAALSFIEEGAPEFYAIVTNNIGIIQRGENSGILSSRTPPTFYVGERTYKKSNLWYASAIVHDANHSKLYHDYLKEHGPPVPYEKHGGRSGEDACLSVQADFLRAVNAPEATIRYVMRMKKVDYFSPGVKRDW
jgi:hypothetical protein